MSYKARGKQLEHDDSAFLYFASSVLGLILVPVLYNFVVYGVIGKSREKEFPLNSSDCEIKKCGCSVCEERMRKREEMRRTTLFSRLKSRIIQVNSI